MKKQQNQIKGITKTGFKFYIDKDTIDDYEFVELVSEVDENPLLIPKLIKTLLGDKQTTYLKKHVRNSKGKVTMIAMQNEIQNIFEKVGEIKNF